MQAKSGQVKLTYGYAASLHSDLCYVYTEGFSFTGEPSTRVPATDLLGCNPFVHGADGLMVFLWPSHFWTNRYSISIIYA